VRIGIDGGCLANRRGFGRFARLALDALASAGSEHEFLVFVDRPSAESVTIPATLERVTVDVTEAPSRAASSTGRRSIRDMFAMGRAVARARLDLIYFPATYSFFPVWGVQRVVVTMHDTLALAHPGLVFPTRAGRAAWMLKEHTAVRRADRVFTVSEAARIDVIRWFKLPAHRVHVVGEAPDPIFVPKPEGRESAEALGRYGVEPASRFLLYVGGLSPHKNLPRLIEAFASSGLSREGIRLILVGDTGSGDVFHTHVPELRAQISRCGISDHVVLTGFVPDEHLVYFYNRALALVQPSLMEGFGLPPVEAMACGTPVLTSTAGSLPEVIGDAGFYFDPHDPRAIANTLRRFVEDPLLQRSLSASALRRASRFSWAATAELMLAGFEELLPARSGNLQRAGRRRSA
jgi:glycosyltransferase involved in cell wall biosynthesis